MSFIIDCDTELFNAKPDWSSAVSIPFPLGVAKVVGRYPSGGYYQDNLYLVGGHTANILVDRMFRAVRQGVPKPNAAPTVTVGAGSTSQICYVRFYDEITDERGPLSDGTTVVGSTSRSWSALPTTVPGDTITMDGTVTFAAGTVTGVNTNFTKLRPGDRIARSTDLTRWGRIRSIASDTSMVIDDTAIAGAGVAITAKAVPRCSHIELWVAVTGALPRFILRARLGTTTVSESLATLALGEAETEPFTELPHGAISVMYNRRQLVAGVVGREDTIFISPIGFPERNEGLAFKTEYGEPVVGLFTYRKYVVVLCPDSSYVLQGVADDDYVLDGLDPDIGGFGMWVKARGVVYVPGRDGIKAFNGAFHDAAPTRAFEWMRRHRKDKAAFESGFLATNPHDKTIQFYLNPTHVNTVQTNALAWVGHYNTVGSQASGEITTPEWATDSQFIGAEEVTFAAFLAAANARSGAFYRGTSAGKIWEEDTLGTVAFTGTSRIILRAECFGDPGGFHNEAQKLLRMWTYVRSEDSAWNLNVWPGDEFACPRVRIHHPKIETGGWTDSSPEYTDAVAASGVSSGNTQKAPLVCHEHPQIGLDAIFFTVEFEFTNPKDVWFIGCGGFHHDVGVQTRYNLASQGE